MSVKPVQNGQGSIPRIEFSCIPMEQAVEQLNRMIRIVATNEPVPYITIDTSPTKVVRLESVLNLDAEMDKLEKSYLDAHTHRGELITMHVLKIPVRDACRIVRQVTGMYSAQSARGEIWRYAPPLVKFRLYEASPETVNKLKTQCALGRGFETRFGVDWNENDMALTRDGHILLIGTPEEHLRFRDLLKAVSRQKRG